MLFGGHVVELVSARPISGLPCQSAPSRPTFFFFFSPFCAALFYWGPFCNALQNGLTRRWHGACFELRGPLRGRCIEGYAPHADLREREREREIPGAAMFPPVRFCKYTRNSFVGKPNKGPVICAEQKRGGWRGSAVGGGKASETKGGPGGSCTCCLRAVRACFRRPPSPLCFGSGQVSRSPFLLPPSAGFLFSLASFQSRNRNGSCRELQTGLGVAGHLWRCLFPRTPLRTCPSCSFSVRFSAPGWPKFFAVPFVHASGCLGRALGI